MSTFGAVSFLEDAGNYTETRPGRVAVQEIPGGDNFYVDRAGRRPLTWNVGMVLANDTAWGALNALIAQSATLSIGTLTSHTATLMSLTRPAPQPNGQARATAEFLITDV